jgi:prefoldin subunit 5
MAQEHENTLPPKQLQFLRALLNGSTIKAAAKKVGVSEFTGHQWVHHNHRFKAVYQNAVRSDHSYHVSKLRRNAAAHLDGLFHVYMQARKSGDVEAIADAAHALGPHLSAMLKHDAAAERLREFEELKRNYSDAMKRIITLDDELAEYRANPNYLNSKIKALQKQLDEAHAIQAELGEVLADLADLPEEDTQRRDDDGEEGTGPGPAETTLGQGTSSDEEDETACA